MKRTKSILAILMIIFVLVGCTGMSTTQQSTVSGGAMGAAGGAVLGAVVGGH